MKIITLASRKGGAGKTTVARNLAVAAELAGEGPVALVDIDPQGGLAAWWNRREAETPAFINCDTSHLPAEIVRLRSAGFTYCIIDTPPSVEDTARLAIRLATLVVVPVQPSPDDLNAIGGTIDIVEEEDRPLVFVVSRGTRRAKLTAEAAVVLSQHGTVAPVTLHQGVAFPSAAISGLGVQEYEPNGTSAAEVQQLWTYIRGKLNKQASKPARKPTHA